MQKERQNRITGFHHDAGANGGHRRDRRGCDCALCVLASSICTKYVCVIHAERKTKSHYRVPPRRWGERRSPPRSSRLRLCAVRVGVEYLHKICMCDSCRKKDKIALPGSTTTLGRTAATAAIVAAATVRCACWRRVSAQNMYV